MDRTRKFAYQNSNSLETQVTAQVRTELIQVFRKSIRITNRLNKRLDVIEREVKRVEKQRLRKAL
jgi:hypothetical protein